MRIKQEIVFIGLENIELDEYTLQIIIEIFESTGGRNATCRG